MPSRSPLGFLPVAVSIVLGFPFALRARAMDTAVFARDGRQITVTGRKLATTLDEGLIIQGRDGVIWGVDRKELVSHTADGRPFEALKPEELGERVLQQLPPGFQVHTTAHYVICYATSREYAYWCGGLFERLYSAFTNFWSRRRFPLTEPEFPLVAVIFADRRSYVQFCKEEAGEAIGSMIGFYSMTSNRMTMYDLTGLGNSASSTRISRILAQPEAAQTVSTIIHEATHQIAFNCGLHVRFSDCPLWFSEGIAMYFETPDLRTSKGWRGIGEVSRERLRRFKEYLPRRPPGSLRTLITDDNRLRDTENSLDAYAEAWALTYYLLRRDEKQYLDYARTIAQKDAFLDDTPEKRLLDFRRAFGDDLEALDEQFVRYMRTVR